MNLKVKDRVVVCTNAGPEWVGVIVKCSKNEIVVIEINDNFIANNTIPSKSELTDTFSFVYDKESRTFINKDRQEFLYLVKDLPYHFYDDEE